MLFLRFQVPVSVIRFFVAAIVSSCLFLLRLKNEYGFGV